MTEERLEAWMAGEIEDDELTAAEVRDLQDRVNAAIVRKTLQREGAHTFPQHMTVQ